MDTKYINVSTYAYKSTLLVKKDIVLSLTSPKQEQEKKLLNYEYFQSI